MKKTEFIQKFNLAKTDKDSKYVLISLNVKRFKMYNQIYGTSEGSKLLNKIENYLMNNLRENEFLLQVYGDCFVLLLKYDDKMSLIERIISIDYKIYLINEVKQHFKIFLSFGIYVINENDNFYNALDCANIARKNDKDYIKANSSYEFYDTQYKENSNFESWVYNHMQKALDNKEFVAYLQPKVDTNTKKIVEAEALMRWIHQGKEIPLKDCMPILNKTWFIRKIDLYMFERVCQILVDWKKRGLDVIPISVNVSEASFRDEDYLDEMMMIYSNYNVNKDLIEFELSEEIAKEDNTNLVIFMKKINRLGFECSLDDFGSGNSSLNILSDLPIKTLKLDQRFFRGELTKEAKFIIASSMGVANYLNFNTVAEGVEDENYYQFLKEIGCHQIQGFYFSKAVCVKDFEALLETQPYANS